MESMIDRLQICRLTQTNRFKERKKERKNERKNEKKNERKNERKGERMKELKEDRMKIERKKGRKAERKKGRKKEKNKTATQTVKWVETNRDNAFFYSQINMKLVAIAIRESVKTVRIETNGKFK